MRGLTKILLITVLILTGCQSSTEESKEKTEVPVTTVVKPPVDTATTSVKQMVAIPASNTIETKDHTPEEILTFARTLIGVPYLFASTDPAKGFDCSGFITYVFNHFNIGVPRSSVEFTNYGEEIPIDESEPGDLILFTGTDSSNRRVGHMGLVESWRNDTLFFIHSSSGKANGVVITPFQKYYQGRFVKVIRVFPEEYFSD